jgi:ankyrin repeat protein
MTLSSSEISHASQMLWSTFAKTEASIFSAMSCVLRWKATEKLKYIQSVSRAAATLNVIMPEEYEGQHLSVAEKLCDMPEQLPLLVQITLFLLSNNIRLSAFKNLDNKTSNDWISGEDVFVMRILRTAGYDNVQSFKNLISLKQPTAEALAENLFKSAIRSLDIRVVQVMLEAGMSLNIYIPCYDIEGNGEDAIETPISPFEFVASLHDHDIAVQMTKAMLPHNSNSFSESWATAALLAAVRTKNEDLVRLLVSQGVGISPDVLKRAMSNIVYPNGPVKFGILQFFIDCGADTEIRFEGKTPLGLVMNNTSLTRKLLDAGAHVDAVQQHAPKNGSYVHTSRRMWGSSYTIRNWSKQGTNALGIAAAGGNISVMQMLLAAGATVNPELESGINVPPLVLAVHEKQIAATGVLLNAGADINIADEFREYDEDERVSLSLFQRAHPDKTLQKMILAQGAQPDWRSTESTLYWQLLESIENNEAASVASLLALGSLIPEDKFHGSLKRKCSRRRCRRHDSSNPYHWYTHATTQLKALPLAVKRGNSEIVSLLIDAGATSSGKVFPSIGNLQTATLLARLDILAGISNLNLQSWLVSAILGRDQALTTFLLTHINNLSETPASDAKGLRVAQCVNPLEAALCLGETNLARCLLNRGASFTELELNAIIWKTLESKSALLCLEFWDKISSFSDPSATAFAMIMKAKDHSLFQCLLEAGCPLRGWLKVLCRKTQRSPRAVSLPYNSSLPILGDFWGQSSTIGWWNLTLPNDASLVAQKATSLLEVAVLLDDHYFLKVLLDKDIWTKEEKGYALTLSLICDSTNLFQALLMSGADVNTRVNTDRQRRFDTNSGSFGTNGVRPFELALERGDIDLMRTLIAFGYNTESDLIDFDWGLHIAVDRGDSDMALFLLSLQTSDRERMETTKAEEGWDHLTNGKPKGKFEDILDHALKKGQFEIMTMLIKAGAHVSNVTLESAVRKQDMKYMQVMIDAGADLNCPSDSRSHDLLRLAVEQGNMELVDYLIRAGANVNQEPALEDGSTALQLAAIKGYMGIARRLIDAGADVKARGSPQYGRTALEGAAEWGRIDMLQLLLSEATYTERRDRKSFIRAVILAERNYFFAAAKLLKSEVGWLDSDREYYDRQKVEFTEYESEEDWEAEVEELSDTEPSDYEDEH